MKKNKVLFLDRDGTINIDNGYLKSAEDLQLINGAASAIQVAKNAGFLIGIITNQAGVAKGVIPPGELDKIHSRMIKMIAEQTGAQSFQFDDIQICLHHPNDKCTCRKPETDMLKRSSQKLNADLTHSYFVGDKLSDLFCANRMNVKAVLVETGHGQESLEELKSKELNPQNIQPWYIAKDLNDAVKKILSSEGASS